MSTASPPAQVESDRATKTRARILDAARAEFAAAGFEGGRMERIAAGAEINKERIYAYFGDKRAMFATTVALAVREVEQATAANADDLAGYAERLFDFMADHPDTLRLLNWARLEPGSPLDEATGQLDGLPRPEDAISRWQREGSIPGQWNPHDLVVFIWGLCEASHMAPFRPTGPDAASIERRRRAVVSYVVGLLAEQREVPADDVGREKR